MYRTKSPLTPFQFSLLPERGRDIDGTRNADTLVGGSGHDDIDGGRGNDRLDGGGGNDSIEGGAGNDILTGGAGADHFEFERGDGRDVITDFRNGEDRIEIDGFNLSAIQSVIAGARQVGDDVVLAISRDTSITLQNFRLSDLDLSDFAGVPQPPAPPPSQPERGRDIDGTRNADTLVGGAGHDDIDGGRGNDRLDGAGGNDSIEGGAGNDILTGGAGADRFEFERGDGRDVITDFRNGEDRIEIDGFNLSAIQSVIAGARQVGDDVVLAISRDTSVVLQNFQRSDLDPGDFLM